MIQLPANAPWKVVRLAQVLDPSLPIEETMEFLVPGFCLASSGYFGHFMNQTVDLDNLILGLCPFLFQTNNVYTY